MAIIGEIVDQNPWWKHGAEFAQHDQNLVKAKPIFFYRKEIGLEKGGIFTLRGPRQVGKTTYIKDTIKRLIREGVPNKNILYLSLDFFTSRRELRNAINYFMDSTRDAKEIYIFLDEITSLKDWNLELKFMADQGLIKKAYTLITGSSPVKLKEKGELLPGRGLEGKEYYIKPLSFREFVLQTVDYVVKFIKHGEFRNSLIMLKSNLEEYSPSNLEDIRKNIQNVLPFKKELKYLFHIYIVTGGLPGVANHYLQNRYEKDEEIINPKISEIYIRDVLGDLSRIQKNENIVRQILKAIVERYGSRYTFSKLSRSIERTHVTTIDYLEYLEESFISFILYAYDFNNREAKFKGDKKVYFFDPFVFHSVKSYLTGEEIWDIITNTMQNEGLQGTIVENIVISHLLMYREIPFLRTLRTFLWFYYDKSGREIDAILKDGKEYLGIEVKYRTSINGISIKDIPVVKKYLILSKEETKRRENKLVVPVDVFLSLLPVSEKNI